MGRLYANFDDGISLGTGATINNLVPCTYACWMYPITMGEGTAPNRAGYLYGKSVSNNAKVNWYLFETVGTGAFGFEKGYGTLDTHVARAISPAGAFALNTWTFVAAVFQTASGGPRLYTMPLGGTLAEVSSYNTRQAETGSHGTEAAAAGVIGSDTPPGTAAFDGYLAQFTIHNAALTPAELQNLALGDLRTNQSTLRAALHLDGALSPEPDVSGNNNNGTLTGTSVIAHPTGIQWLFPVVQTVNATHATGNPTAFNLDLPSGIGSGDLVLAAIAKDGTGTLTWPNIGTPSQAWQTITNADGNDGSAASRLEVRYLFAQSALAGPLAMTVPGENYASRTWRISGADPTAAPECPTAATSTTGTTPDPPSLTPSWGLRETLWIALFGQDGASTVSVFPAQYTADQHGDNSGGSAAQGVAHGSASRRLLATVSDPGTFTVSSSVAWRALTLAIKAADPTTYPLLVSRIMGMG